MTEIPTDGASCAHPPLRDPASAPAFTPAARRALVHAYKETRPPAGVFVIRNLVNGRIYVGGSLNLEGAMNRHRFELNMRSHRNKLLLKDWLEHGAERFSFEVVDHIKERDDPHFDYEAELQNLLPLWRDELQGQGQDGYNPPGHGAVESRRART